MQLCFLKVENSGCQLVLCKGIASISAKIVFLKIRKFEINYSALFITEVKINEIRNTHPTCKWLESS